MEVESTTAESSGASTGSSQPANTAPVTTQQATTGGTEASTQAEASTTERQSIRERIESVAAANKSKAAKPVKKEATAMVGSPAEKSTAQAAVTTTEEGQEKPAYTPNLKFKVKEKELEFDDWAKPFITTKEQEDKFREVFEKAYGLEDVKLDRTNAKKETKEWQDKYGKVEGSLQTLSQWVKQKDYLSFFEALAIPEEDVLKYAVSRLKFRDLPADQQAAFENERQMRFQNMQIQEQLRSQQSMNTQYQAQQTFTTVQNEISARTEVLQAAQSFDARVGKPGAFLEEVLKRGAYYESMNQNIPARQAVDEIYKLVGIQAQQQATQQQAVQQQFQTQHQTQENFVQQQPAQQAQKPTIPNFRGNGSVSPAKKVVKSLQDIRDIREQRLNQR